MTGRTAAAAAVLVLGAALSACAPPTSSSGEQQGTLPGADVSDVDVDTPELARLKHAAGIANCPDTRRGVESVDGGLPDLSLPCLGGGRAVDLAALRGEPTVLNVWASWCRPCQEELPVIQRLHESGKVRVLGVDFQDPQPDTALELAKDSGVTYPSVADPAGEVEEPLRMVGPPITVFLRADGTVAGTKNGQYTSYDDLAADVREHLGVRL